MDAPIHTATDRNQVFQNTFIIFYHSKTILFQFYVQYV